MSSFTPGPWKYSNEEAVDGPYVYAPNACGVQVASAGECMIAGVNGFYNIEAEESHANARLISAAPELLNLAELVVNLDSPEDMSALYDMATKLIAKVRGEE